MTAPIEILLVEDNPGDVRLAQTTLSDYRIDNQFTVVGDGEEALDYLLGRGKHAGRRTPDLVLLDLNLPKVDGIEVIQEIGKHPELRELPIVVLTVSDSDRDLVESFGLRVSCYVVKPLTIEKYLEVLRCHPQFALAVVRLDDAEG